MPSTYTVVSVGTQFGVAENGVLRTDLSLHATEDGADTMTVVCRACDSAAAGFDPDSNSYGDIY